MKLLKLVASAVALCAVFSVQARTLDEIKKDGKILIATEGQFAPFNFFNGTTLTGFEVDLAELVAKKMGVTSSGRRWALTPCSPACARTAGIW